MAKYRARYRKTRNPPATEMPVIASDEIAYKEKNYHNKDEKKNVNKDDSLAPLILGFGFIAVVGFALWAVSRRSATPQIFTQGPGMQYHLQPPPRTLGGLPVNITFSDLSTPEAPTWSKTGRQQIEVPDGSQRPPQSNTRRSGQGT